GPLSHARRRLRKGRRQGRVEADVALHLLHDLMNVPVQHRDRPEAFEVCQRLLAVVRHPSPLRIDGPEGDMGEHHDRSAAREPLDVLLEPVELSLPKVPKAAGPRALIRAMACSKVPSASLLASPLNPMCVSLICTKLKSRAGSAAEAGLKARDERMPPAAVQTRPVPAQAMHCRKPRRSMPS